MIEMRWLWKPGVHVQGLFGMKNGDPHEMVLQYRFITGTTSRDDGFRQFWSTWKDVPLHTGDNGESPK